MRRSKYVGFSHKYFFVMLINFGWGILVCILERPLEDHEPIKDVIARWPTKNPPKLVLRDFASKNILWSVNPPVRIPRYQGMLLP